MAIDGKYGRVTVERGTVGDDEPVVVFLAQDRLLPQVLRFYRDLCANEGSPQRHLTLLDRTTETVVAWQAANFTKTPSSDALDGYAAVTAQARAQVAAMSPERRAAAERAIAEGYRQAEDIVAGRRDPLAG